VPVLRTLTGRLAGPTFPWAFPTEMQLNRLMPDGLDRIVDPTTRIYTSFRRGTSVNIMPVNVVAELTISQKIILAAHRLEELGQTPFTAEALTVACWKDSPRTFGLKGFVELYPDSNKILACLMGERGLARRGWVVKKGPKLYELSRQGRDEARRVQTGDDSPAPKRRALARIQVPKDLERQLIDLFNTTAVRRYKDGMKREITFKDACKFWGLAESVQGEAVDQALNKVPDTLEKVEKLLIGETVELPSNGQSVTQANLKELAGVHRYLTETFSRHLSQQRERMRRF
jgi:hypothetical protein